MCEFLYVRSVHTTLVANKTTSKETANESQTTSDDRTSILVSTNVVESDLSHVQYDLCNIIIDKQSGQNRHKKCLNNKKYNRAEFLHLTDFKNRRRMYVCLFVPDYLAIGLTDFDTVFRMFVTLKCRI